MSTANKDTTTVLNPGVGGDSLDESLVTQSDGITAAKRQRVVVGDDAGNLFDAQRPMPVGDASQRAAHERAQLSSYARLDISLTTRHRERVRHGDRLDLIDNRGAGGR